MNITKGTTPDPADPPVPPEPDVRRPKDGDEIVQENDPTLDNPLESLGKAITAPIIETADPQANVPGHDEKDDESDAALNQPPPIP